MEKRANANWEQTVLWQKEKIRKLQKLLEQERQGVLELQAALNGILLSLVSTFGSETAAGERVLQLPPVRPGGERVEVVRGEKGGYILKTFTGAEVKSEK